MHKGFYASGFLYHPRSQQILLQQQISAENEAKWSLFEGKGNNKEKSEDAFKRIISSELKIDIKPNTIYLVYSYFHTGKNKDIFIFYAKARKLEKIENTKNTKYSWFTFKQIQKLPLSEQIKQDITVGQRVIASAIRKGLGERTIE